MTLEVPSEIYKTFQDILLQEAKRLCRDAAKILGRSEKDVIAKVIKELPKVPLKVIDDNSLPLTCPVFIQKATLIERCRHACLLGTGRCLAHQGEICVPEIENQSSLTRIQPTDCMDTHLWCNEATHDVYTREGKIIGRYKDEILRVYQLDTSEETS